MVIEMAFSRCMSLSSVSDSTFSSDYGFVWGEVKEKCQNIWADPMKIDAMKRIWTSPDSEVLTQAQKFQLRNGVSALTKNNVLATCDTRLSYSKACEYGQQLHPGFVPMNPAVYAPGSGNCITTHRYLPWKNHCLLGGAYYNPIDIPKKHKELGELVKCFMLIESLDQDIKICEKFMNIISISHRVHLPTTYDAQEVGRLLMYSNQHLNWYNKFAEHVKAKFILEIKRQEACNKNFALWNNLCGGVVWGKGSFEDVMFSTMISIENKWSRANKNMSVLLKEEHLFANYRLFSIYFKELRDVVSNAKTSVWALTEKIKMIEKAPTAELDSYEIIQYLTPTPCSSFSDSSNSPDEAYNYRKRRGKNWQKF